MIEGNFMSLSSILDVVGWVEVATFILASAASVIYVAVYILIAVKRAGALPRRLSLLTALGVFLFGWAILVFIGLVVTLMAVTLDVQAAPGNPEHWRQLTVMGCSALVMVGFGISVVWATRRVVVSGQQRSVPGEPVPDLVA
jgi:hypothetical protein